jgi:SHS2 domain-containing protein
MSSPSGYAILAMTADKGIRAWGPDPPAVFRQSARGLWSLMVDPATVRAAARLPIEVCAEEREGLLVAWLNELLFLFETRRFVAGDCEIQDWTETRLAGELIGEPLDPARHVLVGHVKAATFHRIRLAPTETGWEAHVVVDV